MIQTECPYCKAPADTGGNTHCGCPHPKPNTEDILLKILIELRLLREATEAIAAQGSGR